MNIRGRQSDTYHDGNRGPAENSWVADVEACGQRQQREDCGDGEHGRWVESMVQRLAVPAGAGQGDGDVDDGSHCDPAEVGAEGHIHAQELQKCVAPRLPDVGAEVDRDQAALERGDEDGRDPDCWRGAPDEGEDPGRIEDVRGDEEPADVTGEQGVLYVVAMAD